MLPNDTNEQDDDNFKSAQSTPKSSLKQDNNIQVINNNITHYNFL